MTETQKGVLFLILAGTIWGLSMIYYKFLTHIPAVTIMAHRVLWSVVIFTALIALQGRVREIRMAFSNPRFFVLIVLASMMIAVNWFLFIYATQVNRNTETSLGYYIYPLVAVLIGRIWFGERLSATQWIAVALAALAVAVLTAGLGTLPWISLTLALTFGLYGAIKKQLPLGPVLSVTCEVLVFLPVSIVILVFVYQSGQLAWGETVSDNLLLIGSGVVSALPLILFSSAARKVDMATVGLLQYINPTLQFLLAVLLFGEAFSYWHAIAFPLIWIAVALYLVQLFRQDRAARKATNASCGVSQTVR